MLKFLRKYQLILLGVAGTLLMVVFLVGPAIQQFGPNPLKQRVASVGPNGAKVSRLEMNIARADLDVISAIIDSRLRAVNPQGGILAGLGIDTESGNGEYHWYLLTREAEQAGLVGEYSDGATLIRQFADDFARAIIFAQQRAGQTVDAATQQQILDDARDSFVDSVDQYASHRNVERTFVYQSLSRLAGVQRLVSLYNRAPRVSTPRVVDLAFEDAASAFIDLAVISATVNSQKIDDPTDEELWAHVQRYANVAPGEIAPGEDPENPLGLGYRQPDRVKLEFLQLNRSEIARAVEVDRIELRKRWQRENPDADSSAFESARAGLEARLRREKAEEIIEVADQIARGELLSYTRSLESSGDGYKRLPDDWRSRLPDLNDIARKIVDDVESRTGVTIPLPTVQRIEDRWLTSEDIRTLPALTRAGFTVGPNLIPVSELTTRLRELGGDDRLTAQIGVPILDPYAKNDALGNYYYITVLDATGPSAPESLEAVRAQARDGYRFTKAYEMLQADVPTYLETAATDGLDALPALFDDEQAATAVRQGTTRGVIVGSGAAGPGLPETNAMLARAIGQIPEFRDQVRDAAQALDPLAEPDSVDPASAFMSVSLPAQRAVIIVRLRAVRPLTTQTYRAIANNLAGQAAARATTEAREAAGDEWPFSYASLAARNQFVRLDDDEDGPANPDPDAAEDETEAS